MPTPEKIAGEAQNLIKLYKEKGMTLTPVEARDMAAKALAPSTISKYLPLALTGTAVAGAAGAFETQEEDTGSPYGRTSREEFESNPNKYSIYSGINFRGPLSGRRPDINRNPFVFQNYLGEQPTQYAAAGGEMEFPRKNGYIGGPGTETSDDIPAMLSDGEFVMTAKAVRGLGDGSRKQGVRKMYDMMRAFEGGVVA